MLKKFNKKKTKNLKAVNEILNCLFHEKKSYTQPDITVANSILIIDPTLIGDMVMLTPALRVIKKNNDYCRITLVCGKWAKEILESQNLIDEFVVIDCSFINSIWSLALNRKKLREWTKTVNVRAYDYALELRGDLRYIYFMHYCNAKRKVSYNYTGGECFLTDVINPSDEVKHLVEDKMFFIKSLGCIFRDEDLYPRLDINQRQELKRKEFRKQNKLEGKLTIGIHPGASLAIREWGGFHKVLIQLHKSCLNAVFVIFEGPNEKKAVTKLENAALSCGARYIISNTSIEEYMLRISLCDAMICNDSGAGHIATAYGVPSFVVFGPVLPEMARPYAKKDVYCFSKGMSCKPCMRRACVNQNECLKKIKPEDVSKKVLAYFNHRGH